MVEEPEEATETDGQGNTGVTDEYLAVPGCKGCADGTTHRGEAGRLRPGHTANPVGRPHGRPNDSTIAANNRLRAGADRAAQIVLAKMEDERTPGLQLSAAFQVLNRTLPRGGDGEIGDVRWMSYLTDKELRLVIRLIGRAQKRLTDDTGEKFVDVDAHWLEDSRDAFRTTPAPAAGLFRAAPPPPAPEEDEEECFPTS